MKFTLTIDSKYHQIEHPRNVSARLNEIATELIKRYPAVHNVNTEPVHGVIRSIDGTIVGSWELTEELP